MDMEEAVSDGIEEETSINMVVNANIPKEGMIKSEPRKSS
jgi:hypothetical protein